MEIQSMWNCLMPEADEKGAGFPILENAEHILVYQATRETGAYSHHPKIARFKDRFFAMWTNHPYGEDGPGQRLLFSHSVDGNSWADFAELFPSPQEIGPAEDDGLVMTSFKWIELDGRLFAVAGLHKNEGFCDLNHDGFSPERNGDFPSRRRVGSSPLAREVRADATLGATFALNEDLPDGIAFDVVPAAEASVAATAGKLAELLAGPEFLPAWDFQKRLGFPKAADGHRLCEPTVYRATDGRYVMLLRDTRYSHRMYVSVSDSGREWPAAQPTDIPDSPSLVCSAVLENGTVLLVGNQMAPEFDNPEAKHHSRDPLTVSISPDGLHFERVYALRCGVQQYRIPQSECRGRGGGGQYPDAVVHDGRLYVVYSMGKEDIWVSSVELRDLAL